MNLPAPDTATVIAMPHVTDRDGALWFMQSHRPLPALSDPHLAVWQHLAAAGEAGVVLGELRERFPSTTDDAVGELLARSLAVVAEPVPQGDRRRVLVIEPHSDDAALSVGATMWRRRHDTEFVLATLGSRSNFTSYWNLDRGYFPVAEITALRNAEARLFMRLVGGEHIAVGLAEAALRYHDDDWTQSWYAPRRYSVYASNNHRAAEPDVQSWAAAIAGLLTTVRFDEVWLPMGVGTHSDHELTRNAALRALAEHPDVLAGAVVSLYQDVPYDGEFPSHVQAIVSGLRSAGAVLQPVVEPIGDLLQQKLALLGVFASQFKVGALRGGVLASAGEPAVEHRWRLATLPVSIDEAAVNIDAPLVGTIVRRMWPRAARLRAARVVRLFLVQPAGRWQRDIEQLLELLPTARFEVYTSPSAHAEVADAAAHARVRVIAVGEGRLAWPAVAACVALRRPAPTAVLSGLRVRQAHLLARLLFTGRPVVTGALEQYVRAVQQVLTTAAEVSR